MSIRSKAGDIVYFKNSGEPVKVKATVSKVLQFQNLNRLKVKRILEKYGRSDGIAIHDLNSTYEWAKDKKYCSLI